MSVDTFLSLDVVLGDLANLLSCGEPARLRFLERASGKAVDPETARQLIAGHGDQGPVSDACRWSPAGGALAIGYRLYAPRMVVFSWVCGGLDAVTRGSSGLFRKKTLNQCVKCHCNNV